MGTETIESVLNAVSNVVWGPVMLVLLVGTGLFLTVRLKLLPQRKIPYGIRRTFQGIRAEKADDGDITPFQALSTALSATIGTGNIAGVATAIAIGGPGAIFWMWVTACVGMATTYAEAVLAVKYREVDSLGGYVGGPMYYIKNGMGARWKWLATLFALFATIAAFGIGNTVQANSVAEVVQSTFGIDTAFTGVALSILTFLVIIGGVKRVGLVAEKLVPLMALFYVGGALVILGIEFRAIPDAFALIFSDAFTGTAATGGFAGSTLAMAIRFGMARGVFSNEAGLGSAPIAHAAARTPEPVRQGTVAMVGTFLDTLVVCTMTALVILTSGLWSSGKTAASLSAAAFASGFEGGDLIVAIGLVLFAFTTILGWAYYGERAALYLFGVRSILPYRLLWVIAVYIGATAKLDMVWLVADIMNAMMAIPNLIALVSLSGVVVFATREYFGTTGEKEPEF